jgi:hypothetical protein
MQPEPSQHVHLLHGVEEDGADLGPSPGPAQSFGETRSAGSDPSAAPRALLKFEMDPVRSFATSSRVLRSTWLVWLASFLAICASPALASFQADQRSPEQMLPLLGPGAWDWRWDAWGLPLLALFLPQLLHHRSLVRNGSPYVRALALDAPVHSYRRPPATALVVDERRARRAVASDLRRLTFAMSLVFWPMLRLLSSRFFVCEHCCVFYQETRSIDEHLALATLCFVVALSHVPTRRRVLGRVPEPRRVE